MITQIRMLFLGLIVTGFGWGVSLAHADAIDDFKAARTAVQETQHAVETLGPDATPEEVQRAQDLADEAQRALDAAAEAIEDGKDDGSVGEETGKLLDQYMDQLRRDLRRATLRLPEREMPEAKKLEPKENRTMVETWGTDAQFWKEFEACAVELKQLNERLEKELGYDGAKKTLKAAFDKVGASSNYVSSWGNNYWLAVHDALARLQEAEGLVKDLSRQRGPRTAGDVKYALYLKEQMGLLRQDGKRIFELSARTMALQAKRAKAIEDCVRAGKSTVDNPELKAAEKALDPLFTSLKDRSLVKVPVSKTEWTKRNVESR
ncbi:MAG: hypothetical protein FD180_3346 [Planctomycetota bacterium]|nr:MAG: hypothetical protein FD180_3346 [Planctomycetota bacterium]